MTVHHYVSCFEEMVSPTEKLFRLIPSDRLDWKPTEKSFTAAQLMTHMAEALGVYARGVSAGDWGFSSMREIFVRNRRQEEKSIDDAVELFKKNLDEFREKVGSLSDEEFDRGEIDSPQLGRVPRWRAAMLAIEHHVSHKAELFMYLKFLGVSVNTGDLYVDRRPGKT